MRDQFYTDLRVPGGPDLNSELEKAGRVADYLELGELMCYDALTREESCGAHFREDFPETSEGFRHSLVYCQEMAKAVSNVC